MNRPLLESLQREYQDVKIVLASKYLKIRQDYMAFIEAGQVDFGESRADDFLQKYASVKDLPITWHFIGTLQTKKVKKIIHHIDVLHSLDRLKLAREIDKRRHKPLPCFIQVNISDEPQKHGLRPDEVNEFIKMLAPLANIHIIGLMGMAEENNNQKKIREQFTLLKNLRDRLNENHPTIKELSMGMSEDYHIALEVGATVLRLGRILIMEDTYGAES